MIGAVCALGLATVAGPALALSPVVTNCQHQGNRLTEHFSISQLRTALATIPADVKEYSPCFAIIQNQLFTQLGGKLKPGSGLGSGSSSGNSFLSTPVIVVLLVIVLGGGGAAYAAWKRNPGGGPG